MAHQLSDILQGIQSDPQAFVAACDSQYQNQLEVAVEHIIARRDLSPVVLLSGPSGSGKTTTAMKLEQLLEKRGIHTHAISMDNYFINRNRALAPRTPEGDIDLESPLLLDMRLLNETFDRLAKGEWIHIPKFEFARQMRNDAKGTFLKLRKDEVAIFEGIHALNDSITQPNPLATALYVSARSNILDGEALRFKGTWMRILRRAIRDFNFRGNDLVDTLSTWYNVRRGEKTYISPFKGRATVTIDSSLPYEVPLFANYAPPIREALAQVNPTNERYEEYHEMVKALETFPLLNPDLVPEDSLLREFIGGSSYH